MDQLTRIEKLLERIADALEKANEPVVVNQDWPASWPTQWQWAGKPDDAIRQRWMDSQKPADTDVHVWTGPTAEDEER